MKFTLAVVILAFVGYASANAIGQVVDVAKSAAAVGSHGPALVNVGGWGGWNNGWNNGGWNNGWNGGWNNGWNNGAGWNNGVGWNGVNAIGIGHGVALGGHGTPLLAVSSWGPGIGAGIGAGIGSGIGLGIGDGHSGKYVASNRGAVHVAPLTGHIQSVKSTNLQPAPGTNW